VSNETNLLRIERLVWVVMLPWETGLERSRP
jgi:hypothetical protein